MSRILIAFVLAWSAGCAARKTAAKNEVPYSSTGQAKPKGVMRCHMERETGSNYAERVCTYDEVNDMGDEAIDEAIRRASQRAAQHVRPGGGG